MFRSKGRFSAQLRSGRRSSRLQTLAQTTLAAAAVMAVLPSNAGAVVVRGRLTDALGKPVNRGQVKLFQNGKVEAFAFSDAEGNYEIRSAASGRFSLMGIGAGYLPAVGIEFYGSTMEVLQRDVVLSTSTVRQDVSVTATGLPTPLPQLTAPVSVIDQRELTTRVGLIDEMRQTPGVFLVQQGQTGGVGSLFVRGGPSDGNKVLIDGVTAEDVGGSFDWGTVSSTGVSQIEMYRGPNSALFGTDSQASVVSITTPRGRTAHPLLTYSGDAGNLHTWRDEVGVGGTYKKLDYFGAGSWFNTSNALPNSEYRSQTSVANFGYSFKGDTQLRGTFRQASSHEGLPGAYDFTHRAQWGKQLDQDIYASGTLENRTTFDWHNLVRYGIARKREQAEAFGTNGTLLSYPDPYSTTGGTYTGYFGDVVTVRGANGYSATSRAQIYAATPYQQDSNRDELYYQSDYVFPKHIAVLFGFRYQNERGSFNESAYDLYESTSRRNFEYNLQIQGDIKSRLFYSFGGSLQKNHLYGLAGEPRLGLAYVPVRPGSGWFHGTKLRINVSTGVQEPALALEYYSLKATLLRDGDATDAANFAQIGPERSRTLDVGIDQNILSNKLVLKAGFFHNQFSHQIEYVDNVTIGYFLKQTPPENDPNFFGAEVNSQAYRAVGAETELEWNPLNHWFVRGGYTFLATTVEQSLSSDMVALYGGYPNENSKYPGIPIGSTSPLVGGRVFRRPPHTGFFSVSYTSKRFSANLKGALASRADDSTYLGGYSPSYGNDLLLPNRNLDFGYVKLDLGGTYQLARRVSVFTQLDNLLNNQHIGPIGYPGLPLSFRAGMKFRLGGQ
ncbi:MAG: TonB-dependent receptor [Acidobacteriaceae bacterium]|nr:TonB-dependent receptor [Acidobacteriaceae bacterium]